jgi:exodeoxyribonuclease V gamma subunit
MAMMLEYTDGQAEETARFSSAAENLPVGQTPSLLARFQDSILDLTLPEAGAWPLAATDRSVEIHVAHSLMRQMEILHDQLRLAFEEDATLTPADVLVALPDLEAALPLIEAIFGETGAGGIPCAISGQKATRENPVARLLLALMDLTLPPARLPISQVFALLQEPLAMRALELTADDLARLIVALQDAGAHWGLGDARHGWRDALARLFLGYALPAPETEIAPVFAGILPAGRLTGTRAPLLGALWQLIERLEKLAARLARGHTAAGWRVLWQDELAFWLKDDGLAPEDRAARGSVLAAIDALCLDMATAEAHVDPTVARAALEKALTAAAAGGVPTGRVTFTALSSLRQLPYRMICLLALDDGVFPRPEREAEFDLMPLENRPGDRQHRLDERNLFLDLVLAARDRLYLSYTGKSQRDDSPLSPSLLAAQLLEFCCRATACPPERLCLQHPLQAFSPDYFNVSGKRDARLTSFNREYAEAWQSRKPEAQTAEPLFFAAPLVLTAAERERTSLARLRAFFRHPARALLRDGLRLALPDAAEEPEDIEPLTAEALPRYALLQRLLPAALAGEDAAALRRRGMSGVEYPGGAWGEMLVTREIQTLLAYVDRLLPLRRTYGQQEDARVEFSVTVEDCTLDGALRGFAPETSSGLLRWRCANARTGDYLDAWLEHLCLGAWAQENGCHAPPETCHVALDTTFVFAPAKQPLALLADWVAAWRQGQTAALPFYPQTAWTWTRENEGRARAVWQGGHGDKSPDPEKDMWWTLALRGQTDDPLGAEFARWRERLLRPLLEHLQAKGDAP